MQGQGILTPHRVNAVVLVLCAMALASMVQPVPGNATNAFWAARAAGISLALAALFWPRLQYAAFVGVTFFLLVVPCILQAWIRIYTGPETFCHDSVIQFEEAIKMLRRGGNPYAEDFTGTPLERWGRWQENPAIYHFVYPPLILLLSVPFEAAFRPSGAYDQRVVVLLFFLGFLWLLDRRLRGHPQAVALLSLAALNPWFGTFVVEGRNDAVPLFFVAAGWLAYERDRRILGHTLLGLAVAAKTLVLPLVPFVMAAYRKEWLLAGALLVAPLVITSAPFLAADAPAFLDDLLGAPSGLGPRPFEMRGWGGFGFANLVLALGLVRTKWDYFPFGIFQLAALAPCLFYGLRAVRREPDFGTALLWGSVTIFALLFFARFIHDNYIGSLLSLAVISRIARESPPAAGSTPASA